MESVQHKKVLYNLSIADEIDSLVNIAKRYDYNAQRIKGWFADNG